MKHGIVCSCLGCFTEPSDAQKEAMRERLMNAARQGKLGPLGVPPRSGPCDIGPGCYVCHPRQKAEL